MDSIEFDQWVQEIAKKTGSALGRKIYQGTFYTQDFIRDVIYECTDRQGRLAVLKVNDDPHQNREPEALADFYFRNTTERLRVPEIYASETIDAHRNWLIMERLPAEARQLCSPLITERKMFVEWYLEYRSHLPRTASRPLSLSESLPAHEFHSYRIARWLRLADESERNRLIQNRPCILDTKLVLPLFSRAMEIVRSEFQKRTMAWCHGHFKPNELWVMPNQEHAYLTDAANMSLYPEGYEPAFIVWADWIMAADWKMPYAEWRQGIEEWREELQRAGRELGIERFDALMNASLIERCLGTLFADIAASDRPSEELQARTGHVLRLLEELIRH